MGRPTTRILSRELIAAEALRQYAEDGVAGFSLRKLAARLGVKSPSLYNHIAGQEDLVDAMHDLLQVDVDIASLDDPDWRAGIAAHVRSYRSSYARHPEVALMIARRPIADPGLEVYQQQLRAFVARGLSPREAVMLSGAIDYLVFGSMALPYVEGFFAREDVELGTAYPDLAATLRDAGADGAAGATEVNDAAFEWALEALLDRVGALLGA